jgi:hypothetical protein
VWKVLGRVWAARGRRRSSSAQPSIRGVVCDGKLRGVNVVGRGASKIKIKEFGRSKRFCRSSKKEVLLCRRVVVVVVGGF